MALKPVNLDEESKKILEEELPKKARHPHTIRHIEKKLVDKGVHRMERRSGDGIGIGRSLPKGGRGGRFTWEGPDGEAELVDLEEREPYFVEEEEEEEEKEMVVGEVEVAKVAEGRDGVSRIEIRERDLV